MKAIFNKTQFAKICSCSRTTLDIWINAGKLKVNKDNKIDVSHSLNAEFIKKRFAKKGEKGFNLQRGNEEPKKTKVKPVIKKEPDPLPEPVIIPNSISEILEPDVSLETQKLQAEIDWKESQVRLNALKEKKIQGDLIPFDAVKVLFTYSVETIRTVLNQKLNGISEIFQQKCGLSHSELIELKKELTLNNNNIILSFRDALMLGADKVVNEYSEVMKESK